MITTFEDITNHIATVINTDVEIQAYATANLGGTLTVIDNPIIKAEYEPTMPYCVIKKHDEISYKNQRSRQVEKSNDWFFTLVFVADFSAEQIDDSTFALPINSKEIINSILTYKPSDYMRIIGRKVGELINQKIGCGVNTSGVTLSEYSLNADDYYESEDGVVTSQIFVECYKRGNYIN